MSMMTFIQRQFDIESFMCVRVESSDVVVCKQSNVSSTLCSAWNFNRFICTRKSQKDFDNIFVRQE